MKDPGNLGQPSAKLLDIKTVLYLVGTILLFIFALELMTSSFRHLGQETIQAILAATSNHFAGLFIGLLITAMIQSSSTTTSLVVALVASGAIDIGSAVPVIMGANIGTSITSTIVSLGFINKKKEFKRAVTAGTYHDFFNIFTTFVLFPLEYYYGFLSNLASFVSTHLLNADKWSGSETGVRGGSRLGFITDSIVDQIGNGFLPAIMAFTLLFASILIFRRLVSKLLIAGSMQRVGSFFFRTTTKAFFWGIVTTGVIRSSTVTTSMVVPIVAQRIVKFKKAIPFILGANLGTTVTAFMAAGLNGNNVSAINIALVHFLFNLTGILLWYPVPFLREIPVRAATLLGNATQKDRIVGLLYILIFFFFLPFALIYFTRGTT